MRIIEGKSGKSLLIRDMLKEYSFHDVLIVTLGNYEGVLNVLDDGYMHLPFESEEVMFSKFTNEKKFAIYIDKFDNYRVVVFYGLGEDSIIDNYGAIEDRISSQIIISIQTNEELKVDYV